MSTRRTVTRLTIAAAAMFAFGFALVPLYDVFCRITGFNGKVDLTPAQLSDAGSQRQVKIQFVAVNNETMPWRFKPENPAMKVQLGKTYQAHYLASNPTTKLMVAQAVPSVSPAQAAAYLKKVQCFCFERQQLASNEQRSMPLAFTIQPDLPEHISTVTLSYTLFDITDTALAQRRVEQ